MTTPTGLRPEGPADVIGNTVRVMHIARGEERAENMTPERRAEIARKKAAAGGCWTFANSLVNG
ncbi:hypothetical protein EN978_24030 [Mesorhizobium sp. M7A.F.Ca.US.001.04.1.1]|nr:hypothetical protein EN979_12050 [Mesorhizobium sp. M7A.F.Ca.US.001.04.2.1]RUY38450.1 hypothetical protein EN978_24030 [Mesorhizobium sp. M7A.F.Ca.US.001.04.1.1]RVA07735.1 hypothetical protein EN938_02110 [Mesorhizobium sp. M7A.F.Ca.US.001.02.1.1]